MATLIKLRVKSNKQLVRKTSEDLRAQVPKVAKSRMKASANDLKKRMNVEGKPIKYKVHWDNDNQRIKVIIMLKRRKNIPYKRTHAHRRGWEVVEIPTGYTVGNKVRGSKYIYGDAGKQEQSNIHFGRWPNLLVQARIVVREMPKGMQRALDGVLQRIAKEYEPIK